MVKNIATVGVTVAMMNYYVGINHHIYQIINYVKYLLNSIKCHNYTLKFSLTSARYESYLSHEQKVQSLRLLHFYNQHPARIQRSFCIQQAFVFVLSHATYTNLCHAQAYNQRERKHR